MLFLFQVGPCFRTHTWSFVSLRWMDLLNAIRCYFYNIWVISVDKKMFFTSTNFFKYMRFSISNFVHLTPCGSYLLFLGFYCGSYLDSSSSELFPFVLCYQKRKSVFISETSSLHHQPPIVLFGLALFGIVSTCFFMLLENENQFL